MPQAQLSIVATGPEAGGDFWGELLSNTLGPYVLRYVGERKRRGEIQPITARNVRNHLIHFADSFGRRPLNQLSYKAVERWLEEMHRDGLAASTKALRLSSLRNFARWCVMNDIVQKDWTLLAPKVRRPRVVPRDMTNEHVALILAEATTERELLIAWLMFGCGLRCIEVHRLDVEDLDRTTMMLHVVGKAKHEREVPLPMPVLSAWNAYLAAVGHTQGPLVRTHNGVDRLGPERISGLMGRLCRDSGVKVRRYDGRSAHGIRAAAASDLFDACLDPVVVQEFLGHASLAAGRPYLRRASTGRVKDAQNRRPLSLVRHASEERTYGAAS